MLSPDRSAGWTRQRLALGRWAFRTGGGRTIARLDDSDFSRAADQQRTEPFLIGRQRGNQWWWYRDHFYCDETGLMAVDVRAIVRGRSG